MSRPRRWLLNCKRAATHGHAKGVLELSVAASPGTELVLVDAAAVEGLYDAWNRIATKQYSDSGATPNVTYCYDGAVVTNGQCSSSGTPYFIAAWRR